MTNGECIYRKTVDYVSRMALEKDDFRRFSVIWEFRVLQEIGSRRALHQGWKWAFKPSQLSIRCGKFQLYSETQGDGY